MIQRIWYSMDRDREVAPTEDKDCRESEFPPTDWYPKGYLLFRSFIFYFVPYRVPSVYVFYSL